MKSTIRRAEIDKEKASLTAFLSTHLPTGASSARYDWLYCRNPEGKAWVWTITDAEGGEILGVAAAFPRRICHRGNMQRGFVLGDFCIHPEYRTLGPALALQRQSLQDLSEAGVAFLYDFPSDSMVSIYRRLGMGTARKMIRFAKPLKANRKTKQWISNEFAASGLAAAINSYLFLRDYRVRRKPRWVIAEETGPCGEEFEKAAARWSTRMGLCAARTADYLNWRFLQHPQRQYHLFTARSSSELCGYLICELGGEDATVADMLAQDDAVCRDLLRETSREMRRRDACTLSMPLPALHPQRKLLESCGFQAREASTIMLLDVGKKFDDSLADSWYLTHGDRES